MTPMTQIELVTVCIRSLQQSNRLLQEKREQELRATKAERQLERLMMANTPVGPPVGSAVGAGDDGLMELRLIPGLRNILGKDPTENQSPMVPLHSAS
jgi:hypothetical protein